MRPVLALLLAVIMSLTASGSAFAADCQQQMRHHAPAGAPDHVQHAAMPDHAISKIVAGGAHQQDQEDRDMASDYASLCHLGFTGCAGCTFPVQSLVRPLDAAAIRFHLAQIDGQSVDWDAHLRPPIGLL